MSEALEYRESDESVLVSWSLPDLPTAQHKAGLAGLFVYVSKMPEFIQNAPFPVIESVSPLELSVRFTQASLTALMDSVYAGEKHLVESRTKWQRSNAGRGEDRDGGRERSAETSQIFCIRTRPSKSRTHRLLAGRRWRGLVGRLVARCRAQGLTRGRQHGEDIRIHAKTRKPDWKNPAISKKCGAGLSLPPGIAGGRASPCRPPCSSARKQRAPSAWTSRAKSATIFSCTSGRSCLRFSFPGRFSAKADSG